MRGEIFIAYSFSRTLNVSFYIELKFMRANIDFVFKSVKAKILIKLFLEKI